MTSQELARPLPRDDEVREPLGASTRAVTIRARQHRLAMARADGLAAGRLIQPRPH